MPYTHKPLPEIAAEFPWVLFTGEEIAELCRVSQNVVTGVKAKSDSPFRLNKCRPEWFAEWMRTHPEFQLTKTGPTKLETLPNVIGKSGQLKTGFLVQELLKKLKARPKPHGDQTP